MDTNKDNTEEKILDAATSVFITKGMDGARMQEIADKAGINKALLHYYFRSKEKLFDAILSRIIGYAFPRIGEILVSDMSFTNKVELVIDAYIDLLLKHPFLPSFMIKEMNRDTTPFVKFIEKRGFSVQPIRDLVTEAMDRGEIIRMQPEHFVINVLGLCIFPFAATPIIKHVAFGDNNAETQAFLKERKQEVKQFVLRAITPK